MLKRMCLGVLVVLLALAGVASAAEILFEEDFASGLSDDWVSILDTVWTIEDGQLKNAVDGGLTYSESMFKDFVLEFDTKITNDAGWTGAQIRMNQVIQGIDQGGYTIYYQADGIVQIWKAGTGNIATVDTGLLPNEWRHIKIVAQGNTLKVFVDDNQIIEKKDAFGGYTNEGYFALWTVGGAQVYFDNVRISGL